MNIKVDLRLQNVLALMIVVWLHLFNFAFVYFGDLGNVQLQIVILLSVPILFLLYAVPVSVKYNVNMFIGLLLLFFTYVLLVAYLNFDVKIFARLINLLYLFFFSYMVVRDGGEIYRLIFKKYAVIGLALNVYLLFISFGVESRGGLQVHPNYIGLLALSVCLTVPYVEKLYLKLVGYFLALFVCILVSSRTALLCCLLIFIWDGFLGSGFLFFNLKSRLKKIFISCVYSIIAFLYMTPLFIDAFKFDDEYRGVDSGLSGRDYRWQKAFDMWLDDPLFGYGYGQSVEYLGFTADNAYLTLLVECGFFGGLIYLLILSYVFVRALCVKQNRSFLFIFIYCIFGIFEKRYFSVGNPLSILFIFTVMYAGMVLKTPSARRI